MLNGKPVVLLDCDDVVAQCRKKMIEEVRTAWGRDVSEEEASQLLHKTHGDEELKEYVYAKMETKGWCYFIEVFPEAPEGVAELQKTADVYFVTAPFRGRHWMHERREWLQDIFKIPHWHIVHTSSKFLVTGDILVEDDIGNLTQWVAARGGTGLLWDRPDNRVISTDAAKSVTRVSSWEEVIRHTRSKVLG